MKTSKNLPTIFLITLLILIFIANVPLPSISAEPQPQTKTFGNPSLPDWKNITVTETSDFIIVDNADGFVVKFRKETAGYNEIWLNGSQLIADERWVLEYLATKWKQRGEPRYVTWEQPQPYHAIVKRFYEDWAGTEFNVTYSFYGGFRPKISFEGVIGQADEYRIEWKIAGINTVYLQDEPNKHHVKFWNEGQEAICFDYSDVYESFGNITVVKVEEWAGNHKLNEIFNVGTLQIGTFQLDPNFGYESIGGNYQTISADKMVGNVYTSPSDTQSAESITFYVTETIGTSNVKAILVLHSTLEIVTNGIGNPVSVPDTPAWYTSSFATPPSLSPNTEYVLMIIPDGSIRLYYIDSATNKEHSDSTNSYTSPENPTDATEFNRKNSIYCTYTASGGGDSEAPTYSNVGTNTTLANQPCKFHTQWNDNINLSHHIFSWNETGSWSNDTAVSMSGTSDWSNVTKTLPSSVGTVVGWRIYANDTSNNWNETGIQTLTTNSAPTIGSFNAPSLVKDNEIFCLEATVTDESGVADFKNATVEISHSVVLKWANSTNHFSIHSDSNGYCFLRSNSTRTTLSNTSYRLSWRISLYGNYTEGYVSIIATNTKVYDNAGDSGSNSHTNLFKFEHVVVGPPGGPIEPEEEPVTPWVPPPTPVAPPEYVIPKPYELGVLTLIGIVAVAVVIAQVKRSKASTRQLFKRRTGTEKRVNKKRWKKKTGKTAR